MPTVWENKFVKTSSSNMYVDNVDISEYDYVCFLGVEKSLYTRIALMTVYTSGTGTNAVNYNGGTNIWYVNKYQNPVRIVIGSSSNKTDTYVKDLWLE